MKKEVAEVEVNEALPTTRIQLRLHSGKKVIARFNTCHTVEHVAQMCRYHDEASRQFRFSLQANRQTLSNHCVTIAEGGLANAVVIQTLTNDPYSPEEDKDEEKEEEVLLLEER